MKEDRLDLFKISDHVFGRFSITGYEKLNEHEKVFHCIWQLEAEVNNGGFDQYFFNSAGDQARDAVKSLEAIAANHTAGLVRAANAFFGEAGPSPDRFTRQKQLASLRDAKGKDLGELDKQFYKYQDNLEQLLEAYVRKNANAFRLK